MKKIFTFTLAFVLIFSMAMPTFAAEAPTSGGSMYYGNMNDIEQYFSLTSEGTIYFDSLRAAEEGIDSALITNISEQIGVMNRLVIEENGYVTEDYSVVVHFSSTRAAGEYKVVTHWYGLTEIYLNSDQAAKLLSGMKTISTGSEFWDNLLSVVPGLGTGISLANMQTLIYKSDLEKAESSKTGIIIYIYSDPSTTAQSVTFAAQ